MHIIDMYFLTLVTASTFSPFCSNVLMTDTCPFIAAVWIPLAPLYNIKQNENLLSKQNHFGNLYSQKIYMYDIPYLASKVVHLS